MVRSLVCGVQCLLADQDDHLGCMWSLTSGVRPLVSFLTVRFWESWGTQGRGVDGIDCFKCKCAKV